MKRSYLLMIALLFVGSMAMAQNQDDNNSGNQRRQAPDAAQMATRKTNRMAKELNLTDSQKAQVLKLNQEYGAKMQPAGRPQMQQGQEGDNSQNQNGESANKVQKMGKGNKGGNKAIREEYNAKLKAILTEEQYNTYTKNEQSRHQNRQQGSHGQGQQGQQTQQAPSE